MWLAGFGFLAYCYCVGRAKLSGACPGFPLLTHAFAGVPLPSMLGDLGISQRAWGVLCFVYYLWRFFLPLLDALLCCFWLGSIGFYWEGK